MTTVTGIHAVRLALQAGAGIKLTVRRGRLNSRQQAIVTLAQAQGCAVQRGEMHGGNQGVALEVMPPRSGSDGDLRARIDREDGDGLFLILDGVTDPRNLGACLRSAVTFGVSGVIVPKDRAAPLNGAAIRTASGAASLVSLYRVVNLGRTLDRLKASDIWIVGAMPGASPPLPGADLRGKVALVMGAEDTGLRQKTRERCDLLAGIPMDFPALSLNVSVAAGICLYEARRQRGGLDAPAPGGRRTADIPLSEGPTVC